MNILVFPAGSEIGLEINRSLRFIKEVTLFGLSSIDDHGKHVFQNHLSGVPYFYEDGFVEKINSIIQTYKIDFLYPANDDVQLFLTEHQDDIKCRIITSEVDSVRICRSKTLTYQHFAEYDFTPKTFDFTCFNPKLRVDFPFFAKPDVGQGAKGARIIKNSFDLEVAIHEERKMVVCEYLEGDEYTVDCFSDNNRILRDVSFRIRRRTFGGISVNSIILPLEDKVREIASIINSKLNLKGAWFFQLKKNGNGEYKLLEIAPRISGTMGLSRMTGVNYPLLTIYCNINVSFEIMKNNLTIEVDRALSSSFSTNLIFETVYLDFDDTLIIKNALNVQIIAFAYQCKNKGVEIILLTKHKGNLEETLIKYSICPSIFSQIIHIDDSQEKADYICKPNAILIDDSYSERKRVHEKTGVNVFDVSQIELLLDWRIL